MLLFIIAAVMALYRSYVSSVSIKNTSVHKIFDIHVLHSDLLKFFLYFIAS